MSSLAPEAVIKQTPGFETVWNYPLMEAIFKRRSRRVALGAEIQGGPLKFRSEKEPISLSELEEATLIQAATGMSGYLLGDLPFRMEDGTDGCGNTLIQFTGRTWSSPCGSHDTELFFWNDEGTYVMKLHDITPERMQEFRNLEDDGAKILALHREYAVKLFDGRPQYPRNYPILLPFNQTISDVPGSTVFLPIADTTYELINVILLMCGWPDGGMVFVDPENDNKPAGCERWIKEGLLNPAFTVPINQFAGVQTIEAGFMIQNLLLTQQAMGLGGWVHAHAAGLVLLGGTPVSKGLGFRFTSGTAGSLKGVPMPVGLDGILQSYCPPYFPNMDAAVEAVIETKYGKEGIYNPDSGVGGPFKDTREVVADVPHHKPELIQCAKDICNYMYNTYGRFPSHMDAITTPGCWVQAHHLDHEFYDQYYQEGAYTETQVNHMKLWHPND
jgi:hypothetical protein